MSNREEPGADVVPGIERETPVKNLKAIRVCPSKKTICSIVQTKCLYTNRHSVGNMQEESEATVKLES